jgi:hypothetical protein
VLREGEMAGWSRPRALNRSAKVTIAVMLLALVLVAAVPAAFVVGIFLMLFGHVVVGLALFGGSILAAAAAVTLAILSGIRQVRHLRDMVTERDFRVLKLGDDDYSYADAAREPRRLLVALAKSRPASALPKRRDARLYRIGYPI